MTPIVAASRSAFSRSSEWIFDRLSSHFANAARSESLVVDSAPHSVDPSECQCGVERLLVRDPLLARADFIKP